MTQPSTKPLKSFIQSALVTSSMAAALTLCVSAQAQEPRDDERQQRRGPPPEAFEACANAQAGDICEVQSRRGDTLAGQCITPRHRRGPDSASEQATDNQTVTDVLVCRPEHHRQRQQSQLR